MLLINYLLIILLIKKDKCLVIEGIVDETGSGCCWFHAVLTSAESAHWLFELKPNTATLLIQYVCLTVPCTGDYLVSTVAGYVQTTESEYLMIDLHGPKHLVFQIYYLSKTFLLFFFFSFFFFFFLREGCTKKFCS